MKVTTIIEDTTIHPAIYCEHGLSQYIETENHKLLFDTGKSGRIINNAVTMGIDLKQVDTLIISHGHDDHWGGIMSFANVNQNADIIISRYAITDRWNKRRGYISFDKKIIELSNLHTIEGNYRIDDELFLYSGVQGERLLLPEREFYIVRDGQIIPDEFSHEQNLVITQGSKKVLFAGCAHKGIINIMDRFHELFACDPDYFFGGFHLIKRNNPYSFEEINIIKQIARDLQKKDTVFYTGHCTGQIAFDIMKEILHDQLQPITSGQVVKI